MYSIGQFLCQEPKWAPVYVQSRLIAGRSRFVLALDQVFWSGRGAKNRQAKRAEPGTSPLLPPLPPPPSPAPLPSARDFK